MIDQAGLPTAALVATASGKASAATGTCSGCGRSWGDNLACQFCRQLDGMPVGVCLASPGRRLGGLLMEALLAVVTLGIGYLIWMVIVYGRGQTPGKQVLRMKVVKLSTGNTAGWGTMFVREVIAKNVIGVLSWVTLGIVNFWLVWDKNNQELWDKVVGTVVVFDREKAL